MEWYLAALGNARGNVSIDGQHYRLEPGSGGVPLGSRPDGICFQSESGSLGDAEDSFLFCYTGIRPDEENFVLSGTCAVTSAAEHVGWQAGYGAFAVDSVLSADRHHRYRNLLTVGRHRMSMATRHSAGMRVVAGYVDEAAGEVCGRRKLDLSREADFPEQGERIRIGEEYRFRLEKTDRGFTGRVSHGGEEKELSIKGCDFLTQQDREMIYVGFAAAGDLQLEVREIHWETASGISSRTPEDAIRLRIPDYPFARDAVTIRESPIRSLRRRTVYAAPQGRTEGKGSRSDPVDLQTALSAAQPGQTIRLLDGVYQPAEPFLASRQTEKPGERRIRLISEHRGRAVLDGSGIQKALPGFILRGSNWHLKGLVFQNCPLSGLFVCGSNNIIEGCEACGNGDSGILICSYPGSEKKDWPVGNLVIGCDSHHNCDSAGENADGFGAKLSIGEGNIFYECTAHHNVDDGFDLFSKNVLGPIGSVTIKNCVAYENGRFVFPKAESKSGGMGFKLGGDNVAVPHHVENCIAFRNQEAGFSSNYNPCIRLMKATAWQNSERPLRYNFRMFTRRTDISTDWRLSGLLPENSACFGVADQCIKTEVLTQMDTHRDERTANREQEQKYRERFVSCDVTRQITRGGDGLIEMHGLFALKKKYRGQGGAELDEGWLSDRIRRERRYRRLLSGKELESLQKEEKTQDKTQPTSMPEKGAEEKSEKAAADQQEESSEQIWYHRIAELIPEISLYKVQTIGHIQKRASAQGCRTLEEYYAYLQSHPEETEYLKTNLTLKGTHFFRGNDWDFFSRECLANLAGKEKIRVWCASCSSGEEVYSVIMCLMDYVPLEHIEVLASDYNEELLENCRTGEYSQTHLEEIPEKYRGYVIEGKTEFRFPQEMKDIVETRCLNLLTDPYPTGFDVVLCRNTIKFFAPKVRKAVKEKLAATVNPDGYLFLATDDNHGGAELIDDPHRLDLRQIDERCIYQKKKPGPRILFITPRISGGGAEKVITALASYMAQQYDVYLASMYPPKDNPYPVSNQVTQLKLYQDENSRAAAKEKKLPGRRKSKTAAKKPLGKRIRKKLRKAKKILKREYRAREKAFWKKLERYSPTLSAERKLEQGRQTQSKKLLKLKTEYRIDCAVSFLNPANDINTLSRAGIPTVISIRSCLDGPYAPPEARGRYGERRIRRNCRQTDRIVAVSMETAEGLRKSFHAGKKKLSVIYNACDTERIQRLGEEMPADKEMLRRIEEAEFVFAANGRRVVKKGQWHMVRAFRKVLEQHPGAILIILGEKGDRDTETVLAELLQDKALAEHVFLLGFHTNPFAWLARADAFVMSSFNEGFPNALIEAMALGLPVISTDCRSGPREILAPDTDCTKKTRKTEYAEYGILTPECSGNREVDRVLEENEKLLAKAMCRLLEDPELRAYYAGQSLKRASQFRKEDIMAQWERLIQKEIGEAGNQ